MNSEFSIKMAEWITLGSLPADGFRTIYADRRTYINRTDKQQIRIDDMLHNEVNIEALETAVLKSYNQM